VARKQRKYQAANVKMKAAAIVSNVAATVNKASMAKTAYGVYQRKRIRHM